MIPHDVPPLREGERPQVPWHELVTWALAILMLALALWYVPDMIADLRR